MKLVILDRDGTINVDSDEFVKTPDESVVAVRLKPVAVLVAVTVTPGSARFWSSVMLPVTVPVVPWAKPVAATRTARRAIAVKRSVLIDVLQKGSFMPT